MLLRRKFVVCIAFPTAAICYDFLLWGWGALVRAIKHMFVPIEKGGHASCSTFAYQLSFKAGVFQNVGASSFSICTSPQNFHDAYPTIMWVFREAHFSASNRYCSSTVLSNFLRNSSTADNPSYVGSSLASVVTQCSDLTIMFQLSVVTSCRRFYHCSTSSSESEVQELLHSHEILPSAVGFTQSCSHVVIL